MGHVYVCVCDFFPLDNVATCTLELKMNPELLISNRVF